MPLKIKFGFGSNANPKQELKDMIPIKRKSRMGKIKAAAELPKKNKSFNLDCLKELNKLVGLVNIKNIIEEVMAYAKIQQKREQEGLTSESMVLHMIFRGNPGTGKTTVARLMGKILKELDILDRGHINEVERADLIGEYVGHTAQKTREQIKKSLGGVLFIDEAYSLARGGSKDFGKEAIDVLVKAMEDHGKDLVLILAGYKKEMEFFINTNPGLRSRFPIHLDFPDYTEEELYEIANLMVTERQYELTMEAKNKLKRVIKKAVTTGHKYDGNARLIRNIIEKAIRAQALRLVKENNFSRNKLIFLEDPDINYLNIDEIESNEDIRLLQKTRQLAN
ncbi:MAG: AAA family ATPase [Clostridia bacterium]|nr:AAA family ATPase [Clostridia bacterium]